MAGTPQNQALALPTVCSTCGAGLPAGSDRCTRCGTLHGAFRTCPHCHARAEVVAKDGMLFVCAACGKPRVPVEKPIQRTGGEGRAIAEATSARGDWLFGSVAAIGALVPSLLLGVTAMILLMTVGFGLGFLLTLGIGGVFGAVSLFAFSRAKAAAKRAEEAMRDAFGSVALDAIRTHGPLSPRQLAEILGVPEPVAEAALARLPTRTDVRVDTVLDDRSAADGQIRYRIAEEARPEQTLDAQSAELADFDRRLQQSVQQKQGKS